MKIIHTLVFALPPRLPYRQRLATLHGVNSDKEDHVSYWDYIDSLHRDSMLFYNFKYQLTDNTVSVCSYGTCVHVPAHRQHSECVCSYGTCVHVRPFLLVLNISCIGVYTTQTTRCCYHSDLVHSVCQYICGTL